MDAVSVEIVVCDVRDVATETVLIMEYGVVQAEAEERVEHISCETT
jgi:hypothetical protein